MKILLDACVLFPTILREILTDVAAAGAYTPLWSERILQEWRHASAKLGRDQQEIAGAEAALLQSRFPNAMVAVGRESELGVQLPDAGDLHVLKAALDGRADVIVTLNLRDFPARTLRQLGLSALHPDEFLTDLARRDPDIVGGAVQKAMARAHAAGGTGLSQRDMLARARLPRLNKFLSKRAGEGSGSGVTGGQA